MKTTRKPYRIGIFPSVSQNARSVAHCLSQNVNFQTIGLASQAYSNDDDRLYYNEVCHDLPPLNAGVRNFVNEPADEFLRALNTTINRMQLNAIFPVHDYAAYVLSNLKDSIVCPVIAGHPGFQRQCFFKMETYSLFANEEFGPICYDNYVAARNVVRNGIPVYSKPMFGAGGRGHRIIETIDDFTTADMVNNTILMDIIGGEKHKEMQEYTVDCFSDPVTRKLQLVLPRRRGLVLNGVAQSSEFLHPPIRSSDSECPGVIGIYDTILQIAHRISEFIQPVGTWFFQLKENSHYKDLKLMEVCSRPSTGVDFCSMVGYNLPAMSCYAYLDQDVSSGNTLLKMPTVPDEMQRALVTRKTSPVLLITSRSTPPKPDWAIFDLIDTIVKLSPNAEWLPNPHVLATIHQMINIGIKIGIVTRVPSENEQALQYSMDATLDILIRCGLYQDRGIRHQFVNFVKCIPHSYADHPTAKADAILEIPLIGRNHAGKLKAIFVDNSFKERDAVASRTGIPTFDVNAICCL